MLSISEDPGEKIRRHRLHQAQYAHLDLLFSFENWEDEETVNCPERLLNQSENLATVSDFDIEHAQSSPPRKLGW
ncbi:hypothetical protein TMatcc_011304 [Talaromyces marneffei ATCC 18224]